MALDQSAPIFARIPPPVWTLLYLGLAYAAETLLGPTTVPFLAHRLAGYGLMTAGAAFAGAGALSFRRAGTEVVPAAEKNTALVISGPYRISRNPMYLGILLVTAGVTLLAGALIFVLVPIIVFASNNAITIPYEEAKMERQFGEAYRAYKGRVRRWL